MHLAIEHKLEALNTTSSPNVGNTKDSTYKSGISLSYNSHHAIEAWEFRVTIPESSITLY